MIVTSSFTLQRIPTTRSCGHLDLQVLHNVGNIPNVVFNCMFGNLNK